MADTEKENQEASKVEPENTTVESPKESNTEALEKLTKQQSELIDKLVKQTELTNKVNEQLSRNIKKQMEDAKPENPFEWVEEKIKNFQDFGCTSFRNFQRARGTNGGLVKQGLNFHIKFLKEREKLSSEEIAKRMGETMINIDTY